MRYIDHAGIRYLPLLSVVAAFFGSPLTTWEDVLGIICIAAFLASAIVAAVRVQPERLEDRKRAGMRTTGLMGLGLVTVGFLRPSITHLSAYMLGLAAGLFMFMLDSPISRETNRSGSADNKAI